MFENSEELRPQASTFNLRASICFTRMSCGTPAFQSENCNLHRIGVLTGLCVANTYYYIEGFFNYDATRIILRHCVFIFAVITETRTQGII
ncbi:hypothetical protein PM082_001932 [Marasmius tenuissimus]|nr:hypothetical protein PM082_001932 [Marasmius tenuissimus]